MIVSMASSRGTRRSTREQPLRSVLPLKLSGASDNPVTCASHIRSVPSVATRASSPNLSPSCAVSQGLCHGKRWWACVCQPSGPANRTTRSWDPVPVTEYWIITRAIVEGEAAGASPDEGEQPKAASKRSAPTRGNPREAGFLDVAKVVVTVLSRRRPDLSAEVLQNGTIR